MSNWKRMFRTFFDKPLPTVFDDAEHLSRSPSGGRITMWLLGFCLPLFPILYGVRCLFAHESTLFGRWSSRLEFHGTPADTLAVAYIAVGFFIHAHWFWGLHPRLHVFSDLAKLLAVMVFLPCFGYTIYSFF